MNDRTIRNLGNLKTSASTSRVLNLMQVHDEHGQTEEWAAKPLFHCDALNRSMVMKHRLRRDEVDRFRFRRHVATKIILPIDADDLRVGGRYFFVNQVGYEKMLAEAFGIGADHPDRHTLKVIDALPGLDPFLLREQLRRNGVDAAPCYFNLSDADMKSMLSFVGREISPLIELCFGEAAGVSNDDPIAILTSKILSNSAGEDLSALGQTLKLNPEEYQEGIFCWKGFLYYKWVLAGVIKDVGNVVDAVRTAKPHGRAYTQQTIELSRVRVIVRRRIMSVCESTGAMLRFYDDAFAELTQNAQPIAFRDFLREAPNLFAKLGEQLGTLQHVVSFWNYRMGPGKPLPEPDELIDLLAEFEVSLMGRDEGPNSSYQARAA